MALHTQDRPSDSPYIARVWRGHSSGVHRMTSVATSHWELVVWTHRGRTHAALRGPETAASTAAVPDDSASLGISFAHGVSLPHLPMPRLVDRQLDSPHADAYTFVLAGTRRPLPTFDDAEEFVARLVRDNVLVRDPLVAEALGGETPRVSARTLQRRVAAATGLTPSAIRQIDRARQAAVLLGEGAAPLDVTHRLGYYDQPHLARSLRRFIGRTATQLRRTDPAQPLSLLYKTHT
ncbi:helix-turn-helix domain-containing protein [Thermobifida alba]|uniref:Helix-turn-helix domain-containing protein n=1 Tax=Thermobifida alba TaxID=53522 RepID=A0ABY4KYW9_THEAE|nr:helix-turn-helix domain-containing protein [Thermobifida alba]UPT20621.1 helix-turn-helix domain-containing protein [Thermobifida alba]